MANEKFKVKFGLVVGDAVGGGVADIDATTGDITTEGDVILSDATAKVDATNIEVTNIKAKDGTAAASIADSTGVITVSTELNVDNLNLKNNTLTTIGANNLVLNTNNGTASGVITIAQGAAGNITIEPTTSGNVKLTASTVEVGDANTNATLTTNGTGDLTLNTNNGSNSGFITIADGVNGDITIDPNGTGKVIIAGDLQVDGTTTTINSTTLDVDDINITLAKGAANAAAADGGGITLEGPTTAATLTYASSDDSWNFNKKTSAPELQVDNININGNTIISTDTNGNITLDPNGTGSVAVTLANGGNLTNTRNYVFGAIRNTTTQSNGDIWTLDADSGGAGTFPSRGISVDNSADTTKTAVNLIRNYSAVATNPPRLVFERSRGTAASPTTLSSGDLIALVGGTGYSSTLGWINDTLPVMPATMSFSAAEAWSNNTNLGTSFAVQLAPSATTISTVANLITTIAHSPQTAVYRSDAFTFRQGKTGTTDLLTLGTGTSALKSDNIILETSAGTDMLTLTTASSSLRSDNIILETSAGLDMLVLGTASSTLSSNQLNIFGSNVTAQPYKSSIMPSTGTDNGQINLQTASTDGSKKSSFNFGSYRFDGTDLSATQSGDVLGEYKFNGNTATSGSNPGVPGAPGANIVAQATENWTGSANGTKFTFSAIKTGTLTSVSVIDSSPTATTLKSDTYTIEDSTGADYLVIDTNQALFSKPVRTKITTASIAQGATYTPAATALNSIIVEITAGSGTTTIDVSNLTVAGENGVYDIMVYNNSGGSINSNGFVILNSGNTVLDHGSSIANGARAIFEINCIDLYATAVFVTNAV
jgi:hypothetical protein